MVQQNYPIYLMEIMFLIIKDFDKYLNLFRYKFKTSSNEISGYVILKNKNTIFIWTLVECA